MSDHRKRGITDPWAALPDEGFDPKRLVIINQPEPSLCLVIIHGANIGGIFHLDADDLTIGRSSKSDIFIDHGSVSRTHARVHVDSTGVVLQDHSTNGTYVNNERIVTSARLQHGDKIKIGPTVLKFCDTRNVGVSGHAR